MKKFSFRLQKLLDLSRRREEEARSAMAKKLAEVRAVEEELEAARERVQSAFEEMGIGLSKDRIAPRDIQLLQGWLARAEAAQQVVEERLAREERAYEKARELMTERRRELLGYERGREKAQDEWREEAQKEELAWMEEVASTRHQAKENDQ